MQLRKSEFNTKFNPKKMISEIFSRRLEKVCRERKKKCVWKFFFLDFRWQTESQARKQRISTFCFSVGKCEDFVIGECVYFLSEGQSGMTRSDRHFVFGSSVGLSNEKRERIKASC